MAQSIVVSPAALLLALTVAAIAGALFYRAWLSFTGQRAIRRSAAIATRLAPIGKAWPVDDAGHPRRRAEDQAEDLLRQIQRDVHNTRAGH